MASAGPSNGKNNNLSCALSENKKHDLDKDNIEFACSHFACTKCFLKQINNRTLNCPICNSNLLINSNIKKLLDKTSATIKDILERWDTLINDMIVTQKRNLIQAINIRTDSMKDLLSTFQESLNGELNELSEKWKNFEINKNIEIEMNKTLNDINNKKSCDKDGLCAYLNRINEFQQILDNTSEKLKSDLSIDLTEELVLNGDECGKFVFENQIDTELIKKFETLKDTEVESQTIVGAKTISDVCVLPDGNLLLTAYRNKLFLFNRKHKNIQSFDIEDKNNDYTYATHDGKEYIFFAVNNFARLKGTGMIYKTNMNFKEVAVFRNETVLKMPSGLCYYQDHLFVCDNNDRSIHKFDSNLGHIHTKRLGYVPCSIRNIDNIAIVTTELSDTIYFYNLDDLSFVISHSIKNLIFSIGASLAHFYVYVPLLNQIKCFNKDGRLCNENCKNVTQSLNLPPLHPRLKYNSCLAFFNSNMYVTVYEKLYII